MKTITTLLIICLMGSPFRVNGQAKLPNEILAAYDLQYFRPKLFFCINANNYYQEIHSVRQVLKYISGNAVPCYPVFVMKQIREPELPSFFKEQLHTDLEDHDIVIISDELFSLFSPGGHTAVCYIDALGYVKDVPLWNASFTDILAHLQRFSAGDPQTRTVLMDEQEHYIDHNARFFFSDGNITVFNVNQGAISIYDSTGRPGAVLPIPFHYTEFLLDEVYAGKQSRLDSSLQLKHTLNVAGLLPASIQGMYAGGKEIYFDCKYKYAEFDTIPPEDLSDTNVVINGFTGILRYDVQQKAWKHFYMDDPDVPANSGHRFHTIAFAAGDSMIAQMRAVNSYNDSSAQYAVYRNSNGRMKFVRYLDLAGMRGELLFRSVADEVIAVNRKTGAWKNLTTPGEGMARLPVGVKGFELLDISWSPQTRKYYFLFSDSVYFAVQKHDDISQEGSETVFFPKNFFREARFCLSGNRLLVFRVSKDKVICYTQML